jgi:hypothetical protein
VRGTPPQRFSAAPSHSKVKATRGLSGYEDCCSVSTNNLVFSKCIVQGSQRGDDRRFCAQNEPAQRSFAEASSSRGGDLVVRPTAFRSNGQGGLAGGSGFEDLPQGRSIGTFRKQDAMTLLMRGKSLWRPGKRRQRRNIHPAGLLRSFEQDFSPAFCALRRRSQQGLLAAGRAEWDDGTDAELGGLFEGPFEGVELHDGKKQNTCDGRPGRRDFFEKGKFDPVAANFFYASEPGTASVAKFVELPLLSSKDAAEMMGGVSFEHRSAVRKFVNEEATPHPQDSIAGRVL